MFKRFACASLIVNSISSRCSGAVARSRRPVTWLGAALTLAVVCKIEKRESRRIIGSALWLNQSYPRAAGFLRSISAPGRPMTQIVLPPISQLYRRALRQAAFHSRPLPPLLAVFLRRFPERAFYKRTAPQEPPIPRYRHYKIALSRLKVLVPHQVHRRLVRVSPHETDFGARRGRAACSAP